ncbi:ABC transporter ATP-binding protein [Natronomonas sp.]|uniref:ABC transporter ATP-binding protein n=1 Tax=Natronomonas sp. TaxID=2184060 RepID=UPI00397706EE
MLEIVDLTKRYGDVIGCADVSLTIEDGELFSIVGPSGSGKSTLLRCIGGLEVPQKGQIVIDGEDITESKPYQRDTSMVFQDLALFPHMTVRENIDYGMKRQEVAKDVRNERISENLSLVSLDGYADRKISQLSGGEQQRVALARSLAVQPTILLLDEPLASLDQQLRVVLQNELYELQRRLGQTMVYVTHDQNVALSISDRVAVMNDAHVEQVGTPRELYQDPQTLFVASFIGDSNIFDGTVTAVDGHQAKVNSGEHDIWGQQIDEVNDSQSVRMAIKSERLRLNEGGNHRNEFDGTVDRVEYRGNNSKVRVETESGLKLEVVTEDASLYDIDEDVVVSWAEDDCRIYASE